MRLRVAERPTPSGGEPPVVLSSAGLRLRRGGPPAEVHVRRGEVVGLAGLEGNGQEEFLKALAGLWRPPDGRAVVSSRGSGFEVITDLKTAARHGVVYIPRDRKTEGVFTSLSVLDNFAMATLSQSSRGGILRKGDLVSRFGRARQQLGIRVASPRHPITSLSGGNQQKVLLARALELKARVLLLNDPTRGVDLATKRSFYEIFRRLAQAEGVSIVMLSTELSELVTVCDRVVAFFGGRVVGEYSRPVAEENLLTAIFGRTFQQDSDANISRVATGHPEQGLL